MTIETYPSSPQTGMDLTPAVQSVRQLPQLVEVKDATVLVVEDNVANFVLIARLLGYMGIHCEWKTSGYEIVEYADTLPKLDLILLDIRLPYEDGYSALRKLRSSSSLRNTLVVAVTAEASMDQMKKAREAGFDSSENP